MWRRRPEPEPQTGPPAAADPDAPASRLTSRPAFALLTAPGHASRHLPGSDAGDAQQVAAAALASLTGEGQAALGPATAVDGAYGRGAAGWVPVVEWTAATGLTGIVGAAAWELVKRAATALAELHERLEHEQVDLLVSRGAAALLATAYLAGRLGEGTMIDIEAVVEPSALAGATLTEINYVGVEPWLVTAVDHTNARRFYVVVAPDGRVLNSMTVPLQSGENLYLPSY